MENTTHITLALESAPTVREVSMISFNPSTTWGTALCVRESRSSKTFAHYNFWHNCALQLLAQP
jgi:hypothetical protein